MKAMDLGDFAQKKCNSGKNIQFCPKGFMKIDPAKVASKLKNAEIELESPSLLIAIVEGNQVDVNSSGKVVVKTESLEEAKALFLRLLPLLSESKK